MKVLIIGLGSIAKKHIKALIEINPNVNIFALRSSLSSEVYENVKNLFNSDEIERLNFDFIIISNPTSSHFDAISLVKDLKIPLFIEKPLFNQIGLNENETVNTLEHSTATYVACNLRFLHALIKIKELVLKERINEVNVYCGSFLPDWRPNIDMSKVYSAHKEMGGGVHIDLIHELDYIFWLFDDPIKSKGTFSTKSSLKISAIDYANFLWEYPSFMVNIVLNYYRRDPKRSLEIVCENGTYTVNLLQNNIYFNEKLIFSSDQKLIDTYFDQMKYFIDVIIKKGEKFNSIEEAYKILKLCLSV